MVVEVRVERAATKALHRNRKFQGIMLRIPVTEVAGRPLPHISDQVVDAADAGTLFEVFDAARAAGAGSPQICQASVHRVAPRIAALDRLGTGLGNGPAGRL